MVCVNATILGIFELQLHYHFTCLNLPEGGSLKTRVSLYGSPVTIERQLKHDLNFPPNDVIRSTNENASYIALRNWQYSTHFEVSLRCRLNWQLGGSKLRLVAVIFVPYQTALWSMPQLLELVKPRRNLNSNQTHSHIAKVLNALWRLGRNQIMVQVLLFGKKENVHLLITVNVSHTI